MTTKYAPAPFTWEGGTIDLADVARIVGESGSYVATTVELELLDGSRVDLTSFPGEGLYYRVRDALNERVPIFEVGDRVNTSPYTDRYPGTVVEVSRTGHKLTVRADSARCIDPDVIPGGFAPVNGPKQKWECYENPDGAETVFTRRKNGLYYTRGPMHAGKPPLRPGWLYYRDPNY